MREIKFEGKRERERSIERETERQRETERDRETEKERRDNPPVLLYSTCAVGED